MRLGKVISGTVWASGSQVSVGGIVEVDEACFARLIELGVVVPADDDDLEAATAPEKPEPVVEASPVEEFNPFESAAPVKRSRPVKR